MGRFSDWCRSIFEAIAHFFRVLINGRTTEPETVAGPIVVNPVNQLIDESPKAKEIEPEPVTSSSPLLSDSTETQVTYSSVDATAEEPKVVENIVVKEKKVHPNVLSANYVPFSPLATSPATFYEEKSPDPVFRSMPTYEPLSPDRLLSNPIQPFSMNIYRDLPVPSSSDVSESVQFSAFAPGSVAHHSKFLLSIYAYLKRQKKELLELVADQIESGRRGGFAIRSGAYVSIQVDCPEGFSIADGQACKKFQWFEKLTRIPFEIQCDAPRAQQNIFYVTIVVGCQVVKMNVTIITGTVSSPEIEKLTTQVRILSIDDEEPVYDTIPYDSLKMKQLVGKGHFGEAYLAEYKNTDIIVKKYHPEYTSTEEFQHEATLSALFGHHPRIVPFIGASTEPFALMTEYLPNGSIQQQYSKGNTFSVPLKNQMLHDAASGILNLHDSKFIHRDVAARNCLLDKDNRIKICDFGLTRKVNEELLGSATNGMGPLKWMAPESITPPHMFSTKTDSYMFGVLMWEVYTENEPFANIPVKQAVERVLEGERLPIPTNIPKGMMQLMSRCFHEHPDVRPTMQEIYEVLGSEQLGDKKTRAPSLIQLFSN